MLQVFFIIFRIKFFRKEFYARIGGSAALNCIIDNYPSSFVKRHAYDFLDAYLEVNFYKKLKLYSIFFIFLL